MGINDLFKDTEHSKIRGGARPWVSAQGQQGQAWEGSWHETSGP